MNNCAIIGTGPAALMAASTLLSRGITPHLFERRKAPGWKLLVAGSSGLNVTHDAPAEKFHEFYPERACEVAYCLEKFPPHQWLAFIHSLGEDTFLGTSRRYFLKSKKASTLLRAWVRKISADGGIFSFGEELVGIKKINDGFELAFRSGLKMSFPKVIVAAGSPTWEKEPSDLSTALAKLNIPFTPFAPSNAGYHLEAPAAFFQEAEGKPVKGALLSTARGQKLGEMMITRYGLEGTPVYTYGCPGEAYLDMKPDLDEEKLRSRLGAFSLKQVQKSAKLSDGAYLLVKHLAPAAAWKDSGTMAKTLKRFVIHLGEPRPLSECISAKGGVSWDALTSDLEAKNIPGLYFAGEIVDWDAPTGGFLIQACVAMGHTAAVHIAARSTGKVH